MTLARASGDARQCLAAVFLCLICAASCICTVLQRHGIPHPSYVVVDYERVSRGADHFEEGYDYIVINDKRLNKPFIEKPREADNHDNWIYYPKNTGEHS